MSRLHYLTLPALALVAPAVHGATYHTIQSAQQACFPKATEFQPAPVKLTKEQMQAIEKASGMRVRQSEVKVWTVREAGQAAGWFILYEVLGKHEFITYALALTPEGKVASIEIMDYRESYGHEIRRADWRHQFLGKQHGAALKLDADIKNISGATLSCRHLSDGVRRLLAFHELVLKR